MTYKCVDCVLHYCVECDGGEDHCAVCFAGPRCPDCMGDHAEYHADVAADDSDMEDASDGP
jgi:hypothetical protein